MEFNRRKFVRGSAALAGGLWSVDKSPFFLAEAQTLTNSQLRIIYDDILPVMDRDLRSIPSRIYSCNDLLKMRNHFSGFSSRQLYSNPDFNLLYTRVLQQYKKRKSDAGDILAEFNKIKVGRELLALKEDRFWKTWQLGFGVLSLIFIPAALTFLAASSATLGLVMSGVVAIAGIANFALQVYVMDDASSGSEIMLGLADARSNLFGFLSKFENMKDFKIYNDLVGPVFDYIGIFFDWYALHQTNSDIERSEQLLRQIDGVRGTYERASSILESTLSSKGNYLAYLEEAGPIMKRGVEKMWLSASLSNCSANNLVGISELVRGNNTFQPTIRPVF